MLVRELARAKVNLTLRVRGRRSDGYHDLESLVVFAQIHDLITLVPGPAKAVAVTGPFAPSIVGENLLTRTLALLCAADPGLRLGSVRLDKRLPVAAGLGGGSADAAALLRAVRRANADRADRVPWLEIAAQLGADVPVCLGDRPALVRGRGEELVPLRSLPSMDAVLVNPLTPLATASVFAALQAGPTLPVETAPMPEFFELSGVLGYMREHGNDLEPAASGVLPVIAEVKAVLQAQTDCRMAAMSGSGPTCLALFSAWASAQRAAAAVAKARPDWWVAATVLAGTA